MGKPFLILIFCALFFAPAKCRALDMLRSYSLASERDPRFDFEKDLFEAIMRVTEDDFGPYGLEFIGNRGSQERELAEVIEGEVVNTDIMAARPEWEERTIPIRIPVLKGMLGIRLFLIRRDRADLFAKVRTLDELKALAMGLHRSWTITRSLTGQGFNIVPGASYEGLFRMLDYGRFEYFPRGLNEVFREYDLRRDQYPDLTVESTLALKMPLPQFIFVSPKAPRLAQRMEAGLRRIMQNGLYDEIFDKYFGEAYVRARMDERRIFVIPNEALTPETRKVVE